MCIKVGQDLSDFQDEAPVERSIRNEFVVYQLNSLKAKEEKYASFNME